MINGLTNRELIRRGVYFQRLRRITDDLLDDTTLFETEEEYNIAKKAFDDAIAWARAIGQNPDEDDYGTIVNNKEAYYIPNRPVKMMEYTYCERKKRRNRKNELIGLNKHYNNIMARRKFCNLKEEELRAFKDKYPTTANKELGELFGLTEAQVNALARQVEVRKDKDYLVRIARKNANK